MTIKSWEKIGKPKVLAESPRGRSLISQDFRDPYTKRISDFAMFEVWGFASIVLPLTLDNKVLTVRQFRSGSEIIALELPAGRCKSLKQLPEETAREEVAEETGGYEPEQIIPLTTKAMNLEPTYSHWWFYPFLFIGCQKTNLEAKPDEGEYIEVVQIPLPEWLEMCFNGQVDDALSIVTTMLASKHLGYKLQR